MNKFIKVLLITSVMILTGCFEKQKELNDCASVDIGGDTYYVNFSYDGTRVGYVRNGSFVLHSECTPAVIEELGSESFYSHYLYGNPVNNKAGIHSYYYWYSSTGQEMLEVYRIRTSGEVVTLESGRVNSIQLMEWTNGNGTVIAENAFDISSEQKVTVQYGAITKEALFDENRQEWACTWREDGSILDYDSSCANEFELDMTHLGVYVHSQEYFDELLSSKRTYNTNQEKIQDAIQDFWDYYY